MRLNVFASFVGFIMLAAATYCPMLRPFHLFNMNVYGLNKPYGIVILLIAVVGILATVLNQAKIMRLAAFISLASVVLLYIAALIKVNTSFSFIPFHSIDALLTRQIKFKWGWYFLIGGALLSVLGALFKSESKYRSA